MDSYSTQYGDAHGSETTTITNDGDTLCLAIRGLQLRGDDFDSLELPSGASSEERARIPTSRDCLCSCRIICEIPVRIQNHDRESFGTLHADLVLGDPSPDGGLDGQELSIMLNYDGQRFVGSGLSGWYEDELNEIQNKLPDGVFIKSCINCQYSDYSPTGHGFFGSMMCFRNIKDEYIRVNTKEQFWTVHDRYDRMVQEIYFCWDFLRRVPGTGYRG